MGEQQLKVYKIKSIDKRPMFIPKLKLYPNGIAVSIGKEIKVTEKEKANLLKTRNGKNNSFVEVIEDRPSRKQRDNSEV